MAKIFVGLSGGVDSAVSAALLKEQGHSVVGAFIKIWRPEFIECPWQKERLEAMRVCAFLKIPFREIDLSDVYKRDVIDSMIADYQRGITPNPDVLCNRSIKFGAFKDWALREGAEFVATGHYAQIRTEAGEYHLYRGTDRAKDQSYFLSRLGHDDLAVARFPVGGYEKSEVRALAQRFGLPNAAKRDSQGLCFAGDVSMRDFLARYIQLEKGVVLDTHGTTIGEHDGAALYTLGERHGFRIKSGRPDSSPNYVVAIDTARNAITVSPSKDDAKVTEITLTEMQWIGTAPRMPYSAEAQARYREEPVTCTIPEEDAREARFSVPHLAPPGQILAMYEGERLRGSAIIQSAHN